jgi:hypothetical protein
MVMTVVFIVKQLLARAVCRAHAEVYPGSRSRTSRRLRADGVAIFWVLKMAGGGGGARCGAAFGGAALVIGFTTGLGLGFGTDLGTGVGLGGAFTIFSGGVGAAATGCATTGCAATGCAATGASGSGSLATVATAVAAPAGARVVL